MLIKLSKTCLLSSQGDSSINKVNQAQLGTSIQAWTDSAMQLHTLITRDLDHQKEWSLTIWNLMKINTLIILYPRHYSKLRWVKQHNHLDMYREHKKPDREIIKSIAPKL